MRAKKLLPFAPLLALSLSSCRKEPASSVSKTAGEAYYNALSCRACHRIGAQGGDSAPDLTLVGLRRNRAWLDTWLKDPSAWKKDTLMPNPLLAVKTRQAIVDYLASLKGPWESPPAGADPVARGKLIYERAGCIACHGQGGFGGHPNNNVAGNLIPALNSVSQSYTKEELKELITRGKTPQKQDPSGPEPLVSMPAWGQVLKDEDVAAVAEYLFTLSSGSKPEF